MARPTDEYVIDRFHKIFVMLPEPERRGIITGLRSASLAIAASRCEATLPLFDTDAGADSEDD